MGSSFMLYLFVGVTGCIFGLCRDGSVSDNVLNAFGPDDVLANVARLALTIVLSFCFPLLLIPCRDSCIRYYTAGTS
jgi:hypothetical protein